MLYRIAEAESAFAAKETHWAQKIFRAKRKKKLPNLGKAQQCASVSKRLHGHRVQLWGKMEMVFDFYRNGPVSYSFTSQGG
jgi:hypothetical protein